jgi:Mlc titration factor MtfA (ptsG expression regulator)
MEPVRVCRAWGFLRLLTSLFEFKERRRRRIRERPFPLRWLAVLRRNVPYYGQLSSDEQGELLGHIQVFIHEKHFEGCEGLVITDEIRVTIAAQACILLLGRETDYYPRMGSILVYPHDYFAQTRKRMPDGTVMEDIQGRRGESWYRGPVVLSWDDIQRSAADPHDGHNVVFHEFAHQLDSESGAVEGAPALPRRSMYVAWARVLGREYERLIADLEHHHQHFIDAYGATNPAEFFAVVTEAFFEQPRQLRQKHPELYEQMMLFYRQDPAACSMDKGL